MFTFYKEHYDELADLAVKADMRRYLVEDEGAKHYIDIDQYETALPLDTICVSFDSAVSLFGLEYVHEHGVAPWNLIRLKYALTKAFERMDESSIIRISADLGHYVGDIHVPLHTHSNYNGQQTDQLGIHALWESRLPEKFFEGYDLFNGSASYWESVHDSIWKIIEESHALVQRVFKEELLTKNSLEESARYTHELRNGKSFRNYSARYLRRYNSRLGDMVERRMRSAIRAAASLWFSAWVDAGQPSLEGVHGREFPKDIPLIDSTEGSQESARIEVSRRAKIH